LRGRLGDLLASPAHARHEDRWLQVVLTDPQRPPAAMDRLRERFPHTLALGFEPDGADDGGDRSWSERIRERSELDIARDFVAEVSGEPAGEAERALLHEAFEACRMKEATA
jgi:exonuclease SbcD